MLAYKSWQTVAVALLLVLAGVSLPSEGAASGPFYVVAGEALLRECPSPDCGILTRLYRSDQVEYLDTNSYGWWKVRVVRTGLVGWVTADLLSAVPSPPPPAYPPYSPHYYYVAANNIALRTYPLYSSGVTGTAMLNDRVEKLGDSPQGWTKVRNLRDGAEGWIVTRYLSPQPVAYSRPTYSAPKKRVKRSTPAATEEKEEKEEKAPASQEKAKPM